MQTPFPIFLATLPGLEADLTAEARALGLPDPRPVAGGVETAGTWPDVWRANVQLRMAQRVLVRLASFRALHLAQLDKRARKLPWAEWLPGGHPLRIEAACSESRIYHAGAAAQRIARAATEATAAPEADPGDESALRLLARIEDDLCTISLDTSGAPLHRRGHKQAVAKAPLRETIAAAFLARMGHTGAGPVIDPMCGAGTFVIEAAEIALGLAPGRSRDFAFELLPGHDPEAVAALRSPQPRPVPDVLMQGSDRDDGAIRSALANAERAGVGGITAFHRAAISDLTRPPGPPGLVMVNPPYGARIGQRKLLFGLYGALGGVLRARFAGWRVGLVTSDAGLARATGLPFGPPGPAVTQGGLRITLYQTGPL